MVRILLGLLFIVLGAAGMISGTLAFVGVPLLLIGGGLIAWGAAGERRERRDSSPGAR